MDRRHDPRDPRIQQKHTPTSSHGTYHHKNNMTSPSHSRDMASSSGARGDKRMTRWEPGVDLGKLVSLFSSSKKDKRPPMPPSKQPSPSSYRPQASKTPAVDPLQYAAANNGRVGRPGAATPDGKGSVRQGEALAGGSTSGGYAVAGKASDKKARLFPGASLGDERSFRRDVGTGPPSPLARNPPSLPDGPFGYSNNKNNKNPNQIAGLVATSGKGKEIMIGNATPNYTNSKMDRRPADQERGPSPAAVFGKGNARGDSPLRATEDGRKYATGSFADRQAQMGFQRQQPIGPDARDPDTLLIRNNRDVRVPVPEIRVSEPQKPSQRNPVGRDERPRVQQGGEIQPVSRVANQERQGRDNSRGRLDQGLGISAEKSPAPQPFSSSSVPSEGGQRVPNRSEMAAQKLVVAKEYTTSPESLEPADYKLDFRTRQLAAVPTERVQETQTHQKKDWNPLRRDHREGSSNAQNAAQLRAEPQTQSKGKARQETPQGQLGNNQGRQGPGIPVDESHQSRMIADQRIPRQPERPTVLSRFAVTPQVQQTNQQGSLDTKARGVSPRPSNIEEVRREHCSYLLGHWSHSFRLSPDTSLQVRLTNA